jgi:thymidylate synthase
LRALAAAAHQERFDLLVEIEAPRPDAGDYLRNLDRVLDSKGWQNTATVANTIFPAALAASSRSRERLYERYLRLHSALRRASRKNGKGLYFERLIRFPLQDEPGRANQLETIIDSLRSEHAHEGLRHAFEMQVFVPGRDRRPMGFPCLSSISCHIEEGRLRLAATYRNQYYVRKALGNYLGLAGLQAYMAREAGLGVGRLSIHAFHARIDPDLNGHELAALVSACSALEVAE